MIRSHPPSRAGTPVRSRFCNATPSLTVGLPPRSLSLPVLLTNEIENSTRSPFSRKESADVQANRTAGVDGRERC
jgi:hypothetical protein